MKTYEHQDQRPETTVDKVSSSCEQPRQDRVIQNPPPASPDVTHNFSTTPSLAVKAFDQAYAMGKQAGQAGAPSIPPADRWAEINDLALHLIVAWLFGWLAARNPNAPTPAETLAARRRAERACEPNTQSPQS